MIFFNYTKNAHNKSCKKMYHKLPLLITKLQTHTHTPVFMCVKWNRINRNKGSGSDYASRHKQIKKSNPKMNTDYMLRVLKKMIFNHHFYY